MDCFNITSEDGHALNSYHWPAEKTKAVMTLIHGFGEHAGRYDHLAKHMNAHGISVIAVDLQGHGKTEGTRGLVKDFDVFRGDLKAALTESAARHPGAAHILFGHSMGGGIVLDHGLGAPVCDLKGIIASAPLIQLAQPVPKPMEWAARIMRKLAPGKTMSSPIDGTKISRLQDEQDTYMSDPLNHGNMGFGLAVAMVDTGKAILENRANWKTPLLLMHSRDDQLTAFSASETFAASAENCEFIAFEGCEHEIHNDAPRMEFYKAVTDFIEARI